MHVGQHDDDAERLGQRIEGAREILAEQPGGARNLIWVGNERLAFVARGDSGNIAQVFSTYESRHTKDAEPFQRGINSFQLLFDGHRWWVVTIYWQGERPGLPIPKQYGG